MTKWGFIIQEFFSAAVGKLPPSGFLPTVFCQPPVPTFRELYFECRVLNNAMETMTTEITSFKNKLHALSKLEIDNKVMVAGYKKILMDLQAELKNFET